MLRTQVIDQMIRKKVVEAIKKEWAKLHDEEEWTGSEAQRKELIGMLESADKRKESVETLMEDFAKPMESWQLIIFVDVLYAFACLGNDSRNRLFGPLYCMQEWRKHSFEFAGAMYNGVMAGMMTMQKSAWDAYRKAMVHPLERLNYSAAEIKEVMDKRDFAPNGKRPEDMANEALQSLKSEGNTAFAAKDFATALSKYGEALKIAEMSDDTRAILHSNRAACAVEMENFVLAFDEAKLAIDLIPCWFKPHVWLYRSCNALGKYYEALMSASIFPDQFPDDWKNIAAAELMKAHAGWNKQALEG